MKLYEVLAIATLGLVGQAAIICWNMPRWSLALAGAALVTAVLYHHFHERDL